MLQLFKMEDVSMGMWVEQFNSSRPVEYVHSLKFCQFGCIEDYYTAHYQSPRQMTCMWDKLQHQAKPLCCNMRWQRELGIDEWGKDSLHFFFSQFPQLLCFWENKWYSPLCLYHILFIYFFKSIVIEKIERERNGEDHFQGGSIPEGRKKR